jgi:hypothetical protein
MGSSSATEHILSWSKDANCGSTATWRRLQQCYKPRRNQLISQPTDFGEALTRQIPRCDDEFSLLAFAKPTEKPICGQRISFARTCQSPIGCSNTTKLGFAPM